MEMMTCTNFTVQHNASHDNERLERIIKEQSLLLAQVTKQLQDTKLVTEQLQLSSPPKLPQQQVPIHKGKIMENALVRDEQRPRRNSASTKTLSKWVDKTVQVAVSPSRIVLQCLLVDHGHVHEVHTTQSSLL